MSSGPSEPPSGGDGVETQGSVNSDFALSLRFRVAIRLLIPVLAGITLSALTNYDPKGLFECISILRSNEQDSKDGAMPI